MQDIETYSDYRDHVTAAVDSIEEEYENYGGELGEMIWKIVENDQIIIYNSYHLDILQHSENEPDEWKHLVSEDASWQKVIKVMAFDVYRQDVWEEVEKRDLE